MTSRDLSYLDALNTEQREAVEHFEGPLLVLAGAGSGKTRVLTTRIAYLADHHGVDPASIMAVTFTNKAAEEMRGRVLDILGAEPAGMWIGTFHSIGARLMRRHATRLGYGPDFTILDADDSLRTIKRVMEQRNVPRRWKPKAVRAVISDAKNRLITPERFADTAHDPFVRMVADIYPRYQETLHRGNSFDFDDLLVKPVELFEQMPAVLERFRQRFTFILVDEYQDTNQAQYRFVELLAHGHGNLCVVGDDDQSIYGWRGADIRNILEFERDFPDARTIRLERNYRSTKTILRAANQVIAENVNRKGKTLFTEKHEGAGITLLRSADEVDEAEWIAGEIGRLYDTEPDGSYRDYVVVYRTNAQSRALEEAFRRADIRYRIIGGVRFYERREIRDVLAYLKLISNPKDVASFIRIVNYPRRGIGEATLTALLEAATAAAATPLEVARTATRLPAIPTSGAESLERFAGMIDRYRGLAPHIGVHELLGELLGELALLEALREEGPDGADRVQNVEELVAAAAEFDAESALEAEDLQELNQMTELDLFLQKVALVADVDNLDPEVDAVTLMTLHNAKGLEFRVVFISGLEEGLFPLARAQESVEELEEERRLFYVGITRAKERLYLTCARARRRAGDWIFCSPSSFLRPLHDESLAEVETDRHAERVTGRRHRREWSKWTERREPERGSGGDLTYDYADTQEVPEMPDLAEGAQVRHPRFGVGTVAQVDGHGWQLKAVIDFDTVGRKKVVVRYANLELV